MASPQCDGGESSGEARAAGRRQQRVGDPIFSISSGEATAGGAVGRRQQGEQWGGSSG
jgi:hypothetical protein